MKNFRCGVCDQVLYFDGTRCVNCGSVLCFLPDRLLLSAVRELPTEGDERVQLQPLGAGADEQARYHYCRNYTESDSCNWGIRIPNAPGTASAAPTPSPDAEYCESCQLNEIVPNLSEPGSLERWKRMESAKRLLLYSLLRLGLGYTKRTEDPVAGLAFKFLADQPGSPEPVLTGHADGVITINIAEADPAWRESMRIGLGEAYRTLLGHFRHESGHYYWDRLVKGSPMLEPFRALFGDDRADYSAALRAHYPKASNTVRQPGFISTYAQMHPWEDWAETWAHYLHMVDTLETAQEYGLAIAANTGTTVRFGRRLDFSDFDGLLSRWMPVTLVINSLNRSIGHMDPYPFSLDDVVATKLRFVHDVIVKATRRSKRASRRVALALVAQ